MVQKPVNADQDLLGYRLLERIGAGGYGEVWSAIAPGGLRKAVKIIFGYHDEQRAQDELRSLDRVKGLRHPFLLNLERIEVFDGQLVIVTELADKSMAELFNEYAAKGESGIPRQLLLNQLLEAADALDYIYDKHSLQHLDIKPENLLLVGSHMKVADFGLVKDLQDISQSLMGGLTPAYAAPELFDGKPGKYSDQYSLAIVFQEMLTGQRPFPGTTPAALAAQHMNGRPNLRPLPKNDQSVVAKALSKEAEHRYPSCVAMIQELINRQAVRKSLKRSSVPSRSNQDTDSKEIQIRNGILPTEATEVIKDSFFREVPATHIDAPDCSKSKALATPALIIGIGNSANQVINKLQQKITERFSDTKSLPSIRLLCVDTDSSEIGSVAKGADEGFDPLGSTTLLLPLRKPEAYREAQDKILTWLSRRWIYNVPRSLKTEGIRPLGRLAFVDNFEKIYNALTTNIKELSKPELLAKTSESTEMEAGEILPQVFVISSISGGSGSGMMNDMAYAVKVVLAEQGLPMNCLRGVMMHSTSSHAGDAGLATTNSFAFLTELRHFTQHGYPGDISTGLPDLPNEPPFEHCYYLDLGADLEESVQQKKFSEIAEYLFLNTLSKSKKFFDQCRSLEEEIEHFSLRSIGIAVSGVSALDCNYQLVNRLCHLVIRKWVDGGENTRKSAESLVSQFEFSAIEPKFLLGQLTELTAELSKDDKIREVAASLFREVSQPHEISVNQMRERFESVLGSTELFQAMDLPHPPVCKKLEKWARQLASQFGAQISQSIASLFEVECLDIRAAILATEGFCDWIQNQRAAIRKSIEKLRKQLSIVEMETIQWASKEPEERTYSLDKLLGQYIEINVRELRLRYCERMFQLTNAQVNNSAEQNTILIQNLEATIGSRFGVESHSPLQKSESPQFDRIFATALEERLPELVTRVELQMYRELIQPKGGYFTAINDQNCLSYLIPDFMRRFAQIEIATASSGLDLDSSIAQNNLDTDQVKDWVSETERNAIPMIDDVGGKFRQLVSSPGNVPDSQLSKCFQKPAQPRVESIESTFGDIVLVSETEDVPIANVAFRLLQSRPDCIELTKRLHTRNDVDWPTLEDLL